MGKKIFCVIIVAVLILSIGGILYYKTFIFSNETPMEYNETVNNKDILDNETKLDNDIKEISVDSVEGITQQEAERLCYSVFGEKDKETGFLFSFGTSGAVATKGKQYYVIRVSWLVNNSHLSYIGDFFVSADGNEIYDGIAMPGEYTMGKLIWSK